MISHPAIPVADYGDTLLSGVAAGVLVVLPYVAVITAFVIGVLLVRRWLGMASIAEVAGFGRYGGSESTTYSRCSGRASGGHVYDGDKAEAGHYECIYCGGDGM